MTIALLFVALAVIIGWNVVATCLVMGSAYYDQRQKRIQYLIIWVVPVIGATLAFFLVKDEDVRRVSTDFTEHGERCDYELRLRSASGNAVADHSNNDSGSNDQGQ